MLKETDDKDDERHQHIWETVVEIEIANVLMYAIEANTAWEYLVRNIQKNKC